MGVGSAIAIYFIIWWICLFVILPLRVRSQVEAGEIVPGSEAGAPEKPYLLWKLGLTTLLALVIFAGVYAIILYKPIPLSAVSFMSLFE